MRTIEWTYDDNVNEESMHDPRLITAKEGVINLPFISNWTWVVLSLWRFQTLCTIIHCKIPMNLAWTIPTKIINYVGLKSKWNFIFSSSLPHQHMYWWIQSRSITLKFSLHNETKNGQTRPETKCGWNKIGPLAKLASAHAGFQNKFK